MMVVVIGEGNLWAKEVWGALGGGPHGAAEEGVQEGGLLRDRDPGREGTRYKDQQDT